MSSYPFNVKSIAWVCTQDLSYQVRARLTDKFWYVKLSIKYLLIQLLGFRVFKWQEATDHCIDDNATAPHVCSHCIVLLASHHFRSSITWTSACCLQWDTWLIHVTEAKVNNFDVVMVVHQQILWLQVAVTDAMLVEIVNTGQDLVQKLACILLSYSFSVHYVLEELTTSRILHY